MATASRIRANQKYEHKSYDNIRVRIRKDDPDISTDKLQAAADAAGQSVNAYVVQAIIERMKK